MVKKLGVITSETIIECTNRHYILMTLAGHIRVRSKPLMQVMKQLLYAMDRWRSFRPTSVNSITAGAGIDVEPEDGTGNVTITANVGSLNFERTLAVTVSGPSVRVFQFLLLGFTSTSVAAIPPVLG